MSRILYQKIENVKHSTKVGLEEQIDHVLKATVPDRHTYVYLGETAFALIEIAWSRVPMLITNQHIYSTIKIEDETKSEGRYVVPRKYHGLGKNYF